MENTSTSKRPRLDSHDTDIRNELLQAAQEIEAEKIFEDACCAFCKDEEDLDQVLLEAGKLLDEKEKAEQEIRERVHAQELLRAMSTANDLAGQWRAAVAYMKQHTDWVNDSRWFAGRLSHL